MNLIEKAAERLGRGSRQSLVEKAATVAPPARPDGRAPPAASEAPGAAAAAVDPAPAPEAVEAPRRSRRVTIDFDRLHELGIVTHHEERTRLAEEFRFVKRPLLTKAFRHGADAIPRGNLIMVTSANPKEGKTFTSINLALSMATERDLTVLLVDADPAHPSVLPFLGIEADLGLIDLLERDDLDVSDVLLRTNRDNLSVIPAGRQHPHTTELMASDRMTRFMGDIAERYADRVIIFDAPPVLVTTEATVIAQQVGQIVFVIEAERTGQSAVKSALNLLSSCKNIALLLNRTRTGSEPDQIGTYYYDYGQ